MKAIRRIIIEDFQSHRHTDLEFVDGFNVVVGPSDQGKTAIMRAIRWVLFNEPKGMDFVRVGATKAKVTLIMNDGSMIIRERSSSRNRYVVAIPDMEEQIYEGFGSSVPEEVMNATGVRSMQLDEDHVVPIHLGMQLDPPFLLDSNGAIKAKAIGRMNGVHILDYAHKMTNSELASKQVEERKIENEIGRIDHQLEQFQDLEDWAKRLEKVDQGLSSIAEMNDRTGWLQSRLEVRNELIKKLAIARDYLAQLAGLDQASKLLSYADQQVALLDQLMILRKRLVETQKDLTHCEDIIQKTEGLRTIGDLMKQLEVHWELELQIKKHYGQRQSLKADLVKIIGILKKTEGIRAAEENFAELNVSVFQYDQLLQFYQKKKEQDSQGRKIEFFLAQTQNLTQAEALMQDVVQENQRLDRLKDLKNRFLDYLENKQKIEAFNQRTAMIPLAETKCDEVQRMDSVHEQLIQLKSRLAATVTEKINTQEEVQQWEQKIERLAEEYSQQLKRMGRCPICLGEINPVAVERMMKEIG